MLPAHLQFETSVNIELILPRDFVDSDGRHAEVSYHVKKGVVRRVCQGR